VEKLNKLWKHYYDRVDGIIFVVDSTDTVRVEDVKDELANIILEPSLKEVPILVFWNKTDISEDASVETQLFDKLKCLKSTNDNFEIMPWSAKSGAGVWEGVLKLNGLFIK